ncbi:MAG TPA: cupin domain-containing protein [Flavisolibacter sp.]|nr:cupin domain-containing protein [Flavisolibacter sp.]
MQDANNKGKKFKREGCEKAVPPPPEGARGRPPVSKYHSLKHYQWGEGCDGWNLVDDASLSVKQEHMPAGTSEQRHYHQKAQQFFYILKGKAQFEEEGEFVLLHEGEGLHIEAGKKHQISNPTNEGLEFLLCSQPSTQNDRINCQE